MNLSAARRGTGISSRTPEYIMEKMKQGLAVVALNADTQEWIGFCCIEVWDHKGYIANSGLIISSAYRGLGLSKKIKSRLFELEREKYPYAKIFSLTTCPAVISANTDLGYQQVPFSEVMNDPLFHQGCHSWVDYVALMHKGSDSGYVAMIYKPTYEFSIYLSDKNHLSGKIRFIRKSKNKTKRKPAGLALQAIAQ